MRRKTLKLLACASIMTYGSAISEAYAQSTIDIPVTLTTDSAITLANVSNMDFGTWVLVEDADGNNSTLVLDPDTQVLTPTIDAGSTGINSVASASVGAITIITPASAAVNHWGVVQTDFTDLGLSLGTLTQSFNNGATAALPAVTGTTITTTGAPTLDPIEYGGTVTVSQTPADAVHVPAVVRISVAY